MNKFYAIGTASSDLDYSYKTAYACTVVYNGMIGILNNDGKLVTHDFPNEDFMFIFNPTNGLMKLLGFDIVE